MKIRSLNLLLCFFSSAFLSAMQPAADTAPQLLKPLPREIWLHIFSFFHGEKNTHCALRLVNKANRSLSDAAYVDFVTQKAKNSKMSPLYFAIGRCDVLGVRTLLLSGSDPLSVPAIKDKATATPIDPIDINPTDYVNALDYAAAMKTNVDDPPCAQITDDEENSLHNQVWFCIRRNLEKQTIPIQSLRLEAIEKLLRESVKAQKKHQPSIKKPRRN